METITNELVLERAGFPAAGIVEFEGHWYVPARYDKPRAGDVIWLNNRVTATRIDFLYAPFIILKEQTVPGKPTPEQLVAMTPPGKVAKLLPVPSQTGMPYVDSNSAYIECDDAMRCMRTYDGYRWRVELTDAPVKRWVHWKCDNDELIATFVGETRVECVDHRGKVESEPRPFSYSTNWCSSYDRVLSETEYNRIKAEWTGKKAEVTTAEPGITYWYSTTGLYAKLSDGGIVEALDLSKTDPAILQYNGTKNHAWGTEDDTSVTEGEYLRVRKILERNGRVIK